MTKKLRTSVEIETLAEILDDVDYYSILQLTMESSQNEIGPAYRAESRRLHPDRFSTFGDDRISEKANVIFKLASEAHQCLKDPEKRARYDQLVEAGILRFTDDANALAQADKRKSDVDGAATNPKAEKYWHMALRDWKDESYKACVMNIKFALNFEPGNETFKEWLDKANKALVEEEDSKDFNPYKLRL